MPPYSLIALEDQPQGLFHTSVLFRTTSLTTIVKGSRHAGSVIGASRSQNQCQAAKKMTPRAAVCVWERGGGGG